MRTIQITSGLADRTHIAVAALGAAGQRDRTGGRKERRMAKRTSGLALVALGLLASPLGSGAALGQSEAPLDAVGASAWTGTWMYIEDSFIAGQEVPGEGYDETLGSVSRGTVSADDPRIAGTMTQITNSRSAPLGDTDQRVAIYGGTVRIDNDAGAWVGTFTGFGGPGGQGEWHVVTGEGAYEGLTAVFRWDGTDGSYQGVIVPAELPAMPGPVASPAG